MRDLRDTFDTPLYVYDRESLREQASKALRFPNAFGLTVRYAMKASPTGHVLRSLRDEGLQVDCSSGFEVERARRSAGFRCAEMSLSTQELPSEDALNEYVSEGLKVNACSLSQLETYGKLFPNGKVGVRFNPGLGSGGTGKTNVGGPSSSFGIWHECAGKVERIAEKYGLTVERIHTHIGSGSDPKVWQKVSGMSLALCEKFPKVGTLNLGGGYKVGRMKDEPSTDLERIGEPVKAAFEEFAERTGRKLNLEIEPGTFLLANSCSIVSTAQDIVETGTSEGHTFIKLDCGMTEVLRPSLYGAQHPIINVTSDGELPAKTKKYVVVGHCCESGDLMTPAPDEPETISERELGEIQIGDLVVIEGSGAYCAGMSSKNYNTFPEAPEVMKMDDGEFKLIRKRQTVEQIIENEIAI